MTEIERKALALVNEERPKNKGPISLEDARNTYSFMALCRAIEQHEAFRQEVSDAVVAAKAYYEVPMYDLSAFIIAKPDPLVEAVNEAWGWRNPHEDVTENLRAALAARGLTITETKE